MKDRCLRCGKAKTTSGWQCESCRRQFPRESPKERDEALHFLAEQERRLISIADRLDGSGLWAVAKRVSRAAEQVREISLAIEGAASE
jgi:hypothetical protein